MGYSIHAAPSVLDLSCKVVGQCDGEAPTGDTGGGGGGGESPAGVKSCLLADWLGESGQGSLWVPGVSESQPVQSQGSPISSSLSA